MAQKEALHKRMIRQFAISHLFTYFVKSNTLTFYWQDIIFCIEIVREHIFTAHDDEINIQYFIYHERSDSPKNLEKELGRPYYFYLLL